MHCGNDDLLACHRIIKSKDVFIPYLLPYWGTPDRPYVNVNIKLKLCYARIFTSNRRYINVNVILLLSWLTSHKVIQEQGLAPSFLGCPKYSKFPVRSHLFSSNVCTFVNWWWWHLKRFKQHRHGGCGVWLIFMDKVESRKFRLLDENIMMWRIDRS